MQHWFVDAVAADHPAAHSPSPWGGARVVLRLARLAARDVAQNARVVRDELDLRVPSIPVVRSLAALVLFLMVTGVASGAMLGLRHAPAAAPTSLLASGVDLARIQIPVPTPDTPSERASAGGTATDSAAVGRAEPQSASTPAPARRNAAPNVLPTGKGMWFNRLEYTAETPEQIVARAQATGLTHLYLRLGSTRGGFYAQSDLDTMLPLAHAAGIKVIGWDFPYLEDPVADAERALAQISYQTPDGHRIDGFSADIETSSEGVMLARDRVALYSTTLRRLVGPGYPLIGTVPNACLNKSFPYEEVAASFDAIAPMVYWITRDPAADVTCNIERLSQFGRPVLPIGQAYDPALDNPLLVGLVPGYDHLARFMTAAADHGAAGVSFWVWHTASPEMWQAIVDADGFSLSPMAPGHGNPAQVAVLQRLLNTYGYAVTVDGRYEATTVGALAQLQADLGLPATGELDAHTLEILAGVV